jgi:hypothetical protein
MADKSTQAGFIDRETLEQKPAEHKEGDVKECHWTDLKSFVNSHRSCKVGFEYRERSTFDLFQCRLLQNDPFKELTTTRHHLELKMKTIQTINFNGVWKMNH